MLGTTWEQQLRGMERMREWQRDRERRPVRYEVIMLGTTWEQQLRGMERVRE
jgi:hypothetical protein